MTKPNVEVIRGGYAAGSFDWLGMFFLKLVLIANFDAFSFRVPENSATELQALPECCARHLEKPN
jgi:hypothetical protein